MLIIIMSKQQTNIKLFVCLFCLLLIIIMSRSCSKLGHVGSKTRSLGQILEKPCVHSRGHSFHSNIMKLKQNVNDHNI